MMPVFLPLALAAPLTGIGRLGVAVTLAPAGALPPLLATVTLAVSELGRRFPWRLGRCQGCFEVGSYLGHDLLGAADPRLPAALAAGVALAEFGSGRGSHGDLVPGDLLVDGDGHGSAPIGR
jgi:hypothetical protein